MTDNLTNQEVAFQQQVAFDNNCPKDRVGLLSNLIQGSSAHEHVQQQIDELKRRVQWLEYKLGNRFPYSQWQHAGQAQNVPYCYEID
jgi:hypothetical protein